jgi:hypothetical protein
LEINHFAKLIRHFKGTAATSYLTHWKSDNTHHQHHLLPLVAVHAERDRVRAQRETEHTLSDSLSCSDIHLVAQIEFVIILRTYCDASQVALPD